jgi:hypothetical protein
LLVEVLVEVMVTVEAVEAQVEYAKCQQERLRLLM